MVTNKQPGRNIRQMRLARQLTQMDIVRLTHEKLTLQQVSRIETGGIAKPPMQDLVAYGLVLDLTPNDMAALYGYWHESLPEDVTNEDARIARLRSVASRVDDDAREKLLEWVDFAVAKAVAENRETLEVKPKKARKLG